LFSGKNINVLPEALATNFPRAPFEGHFSPNQAAGIELCCNEQIKSTKYLKIYHIGGMVKKSAYFSSQLWCPQGQKQHINDVSCPVSKKSGILKHEAMNTGGSVSQST
jgi:hypothetical protein